MRFGAFLSKSLGVSIFRIDCSGQSITTYFVAPRSLLDHGVFSSLLLSTTVLLSGIEVAGPEESFHDGSIEGRGFAKERKSSARLGVFRTGLPYLSLIRKEEIFISLFLAIVRSARDSEVVAQECNVRANRQ